MILLGPNVRIHIPCGEARTVWVPGAEPGLIDGIIIKATGKGVGFPSAPQLLGSPPGKPETKLRYFVNYSDHSVDVELR